MKILLRVMVISVFFLLVSCTTEPTNVAKDVDKGIPEEQEMKLLTGEINQVVIENLKFMPTDLEVKVGDTVEWVNKDGKEHTVTFENGVIDEKLPLEGTVTYPFTEPGIFRYYCQFHPEMRGSIIVS